MDVPTEIWTVAAILLGFGMAIMAFESWERGQQIKELEGDLRIAVDQHWTILQAYEWAHTNPLDCCFSEALEAWWEGDPELMTDFIQWQQTQLLKRAGT